MVSKITKTILAASVTLISFNAHATLTSYNPNGVDLVYSSVSNVTWTKDANLLGSLFATQGFNTVVNAIIAASPTISNTPNHFSPTGIYTLTASDFSSDGSTTWFGALGYVNYLNSISYGGSNQWYLPTDANTSSGYNTLANGTAKGDELLELFVHELSYDTTWWRDSPKTAAFDNVQNNVYWYSTEYSQYVPGDAKFFGAYSGYHSYTSKGGLWYAWAVSPGQVTAATVPEPENLAMLLAGLGLLGVAVRRNKQA